MELVKVKIEDVYPDEANPRQSFDGIEELAESFDLNQERPGEPFTPPLLVRDGGIYRIVDGERRYRALKLRKAKEFWANVCADMDEADAMAAMLATDDKAPLTELERSRGAQRMLLLGVDPVKVEKAARFKGADKLAAVMAKADDAAEDLTLDRALAASEFLDDDAAFDEVMTCAASDWMRVVYRLRSARAAAEFREWIAGAASARGVAVTAEVDHCSYIYHGYFKPGTPRHEVEDALGSAPEGSLLRIGDSFAYLYHPRDDGDGGAEARDAGPSDDEVARFKEALDGLLADIRAWFWSNLVSHLRTGAAGLPMDELKALALGWFWELVGWEPEELYESFAGLGTFPVPLLAYAIGYDGLAPWRGVSLEKARAIMVGRDGGAFLLSDLPDMADLLRAAEAGGYEFLDDGAGDVRDAVYACLDGEGE